MPLKLFGNRPDRPEKPPNEPSHKEAQHPRRSQAETEIRAQRLHELCVLSLFLHSAGTMEEMMALFLERAPKVTGALVTYPLLLDSRRDVLTAQQLSSVDDTGLELASMAANENLADLELPLPLRSWHRDVMEAGEIVLTDDIEQVLGTVLDAEACANMQRDLNVTRIAVAPLVIEGQFFGLCVFIFSGVVPDVEVLELVAGHCTLALKGLALGEEATRFGGVDSLTWAHGKTYFMEVLDSELARAKRFGRSVGLILLDLNDFSNFNASYGHSIGDRLLRAAAMSLSAPLSVPELVARYGGDEFAILLPESTRTETAIAARRALQSLQSLSVFDDGSSAGVTACVGVVSFPEDGSSRAELLAAAEDALSRMQESRRAALQAAAKQNDEKVA